MEKVSKAVRWGAILNATDKTIEVIKNMLKKNIDYNTISEVTGKNIDEIKELDTKIN